MGVFSGQGAPATMEKMQGIPQFVVHGDADNTVNVQGSRAMTAAMKTLNMDFEYVEVPGGSHVSVVVPNLDGLFRFFSAHAACAGVGAMGATHGAVLRNAQRRSVRVHAAAGRTERLSGVGGGDRSQRQRAAAVHCA